MSMYDLVNIIEEKGKGVHAYSECAKLAREHLKTPSDQSAAYFLLAFVAGRFADTYDDQPLLSQIAESEFEKFKSYVDQLENADKSDNSTQKLDTLNRIASEVTTHKLVRSSV